MALVKVIDHNYLKFTIDEVAKAGKTGLVYKLDVILQNNEREKPDLHNLKYDKSTSNYNVDLDSDDISEIVDLFLELEVASLDENYEATAATSLYVKLLDKWL
jgi:uncharacterized protein YpuA (DUF1002 family)